MFMGIAARLIKC